MKKYIAFMLAIAAIIASVSLAGCGETKKVEEEIQTDVQTEGEMTKQRLEETPLGEYLAEKCAAGIPVNVQFSGFVDNDAIMGEYASFVEEVVTGYGATFSKTHAGGNVTEQISQVENFMEMKCNMIVLVPPDGTTLKDVLMRAQDMGIAVVTYGASDADYCCSTFGYQRLQGYVAAEMMYYWAKEHYPDAEPGSIEVALFYSNEVQPMVENAGGMHESVESHDIFKIVFEADNLESTITSGFDLAETALTANPDLRLFIVQTPNPACGVNNYIMSLPEINPDEWAITCAAVEGPIMEVMEDTANGNGVLRGTATGPKSEGQYIADLVDKVFTGEAKAPYLDIIEYYCVTESNWSCPFTSADVPAA